jgi:hypothetical protein
LHCSGNKLTSLPDLPLGLQELSCWSNQLSSLPNLSTLTNLQVLHCWDNQLTSLPDLPLNLQDLTCWGNQLTSLPVLPLNLQALIYENNPLPQEYLKNNWLILSKNEMCQKLKRDNTEYKEKLQEFENEIKNLKGIIDEMKLVPEYGEYYQQAKANFENRTSIFNEN